MNTAKRKPIQHFKLRETLNGEHDVMRLDSQQDQYGTVVATVYVGGMRGRQIAKQIMQIIMEGG